jgi:hypothetical protein
MAASVFEEDDPRSQGEDDPEAEEDQGGWVQIRLEMEDDENASGDQHEEQSADHADHPCREIRAEDINGGRMTSGELATRQSECG